MEKVSKQNKLLSEKIESLKNSNETIKLIEDYTAKVEESLETQNPQAQGKDPVGTKIQWALSVRKKNSIVEQATLFYEAYRLIVMQERTLKESLANKSKELEQLETENRELECEFNYVNRKLKNLQES